MGEAKRKQARTKTLSSTLDDATVARVAKAVNRLAKAASGHVGADCLTLAILAQAIFKRLGIQSQVQIGFAAWRVGPGDSDVIAHLPTGQPVQPGHFPYHAWLRIEGFLFDPTTAQLPIKAARLDAQDGGTTTVQWAPSYLWVPVEQIATYEQVAQDHPGLFYYRHSPEITQHMARLMPFTADPQDEMAAWALFQNEEIVLIGPNDVLGQPPA